LEEVLKMGKMEDYIKMVNRMRLEEQKKYVLDSFNNNIDIFYDMLKRLEKGKKLTPLQIIVLFRLKGEFKGEKK
jgi:hypothetical protein